MMRFASGCARYPIRLLDLEMRSVRPASCTLGMLRPVRGSVHRITVCPDAALGTVTRESQWVDILKSRLILEEDLVIGGICYF